MKRFIAFITLTISLLGSHAQADEFHIGALSFDWPNGFKLEEGEPVRLLGPNGTIVLISVLHASTKAGSPDIQDTVAAFSKTAQNVLPSIASDLGKVVQPLQRAELQCGSILYSTATQVQSDNAPMFYLQYMIIAPSERTALFTVEGQGDASTEYMRYISVFNTVRWSDTR